jgi:hypothetical protein
MKYRELSVSEHVNAAAIARQKQREKEVEMERKRKPRKIRKISPSNSKLSQPESVDNSENQGA